MSLGDHSRKDAATHTVLGRTWQPSTVAYHEEQRNRLQSQNFMHIDAASPLGLVTSDTQYLNLHSGKETMIMRSYKQQLPSVAPCMR